jgi:hypothetical protein
LRKADAMEMLSELQRHMIVDLLAEPEISGTHERYEADAMAIHRNTIWSALIRALQVIFPTVRRLGGNAFFDQAAFSYARNHPPLQADLSGYGTLFPSFLEAYGPALGFPYLPDVAHFDLALDRCAHQPIGLRGVVIAIHDKLTIELDGSVKCVRVHYPVDVIRELLEADKENELRLVDMRRTSRHLAIWRGCSGPCAKVLSLSSGVFLTSVLEGSSREDAAADALLHAEPAELVENLVDEIVLASFARVVPPVPQETDHG